MTRSGRIYTPEHLVQDRRAISEEESEGLWKKVQAKEYSVVEHLGKTPTQISVLALLLKSESHRSALMKVLDEAHVLVDTSVENLASMVGQVMEANRIAFHGDELPPEGLNHNKALHVTVKCKDWFVGRVLIDGGSELNICLFITLKRMGNDQSKIRESDMKVKAFDGSQRSTIGEIDLTIMVGPVGFTAEFYVMDISASYNLLLGRLWIHMAGAVPADCRKQRCP